MLARARVRVRVRMSEGEGGLSELLIRYLQKDGDALSDIHPLFF